MKTQDSGSSVPKRKKYVKQIQDKQYCEACGTPLSETEAIFCSGCFNRIVEQGGDWDGDSVGENHGTEN